MQEGREVEGAPMRVQEEEVCFGAGEEEEEVQGACLARANDLPLSFSLSRLPLLSRSSFSLCVWVVVHTC